MAVDFRMPKLGLTMEEGTITSWLLGEGDLVEPGAAVLVIETDKAETDVESPAGGRLHRVGEVGVTYPCGAVIGLLLAEGEAPPATDRGETPLADATPTAARVAPAAPAPAPAAGIRQAVTVGGRLLASPNAHRVAAAAGIDLRVVAGTGPGGRIVSEDVEDAVARGAAAPSAPRPPAGTGATFAARALADLLGIDISSVAARRSGGRVEREDVAAHVRQLLALTAGAPAPAPAAPLAQAPVEIVPFTGVRGTIAKRMHASLRDMAQLTLTMDADFDAVVADRAARAAGGARPPSYTDYVIAAVARALRAHPIVNSQVVADGIAVLPDVHVGVAVAADRGLFVPIVRHTDRLDLDTLAAETRRLAEAGRAGKLRIDELEGGTFSVSTLGMFGVDGFTPVINPPNVAILGVGRLRDDAAWTEDGPRRVRRLTLSLTWDHRVLDGAPAAAFCRTVVGFLSDPASLDAAP